MNRIILIATLLLTSLYLYAQQKNFEVVHSKTTCTLKNNQVLRQYDILWQVNNAMGEEFNIIQIHYQKKNEPKVSIQIKDEHGNIKRKIKKDEVNDYSNYPDFVFFSDSYTKYCKARHNRYPYQVHIKYTSKQSDYISLANWHPIYYLEVPVINAELHVNIPHGTSIFYDKNQITSLKTESTTEYQTYIWKTSYDGQLKNEIFSFPIKELIPYVEVYGTNFHYKHNGSMASWSDFGIWKQKLLAGLDKLPESEKQKVRIITEHCSDDMEKIKVLYKYLQDNHRYVAINLKRGGLIPFPASSVCEMRYGDCKALSNLMQALLKEAGIQSYYSSIYSGINPPKINTKLVSHQFNHAMLTIPLMNDTIFLECTDNRSAVGHTSCFTHNRRIFVMNGTSSFITRTPALTSKQVLNTSHQTIKINNNLSAHINYKSTFRGYNYEKYQDLMYQKMNIQEKEILKLLPSQTMNIIDWNLKKPNPDSSIVQGEINAKLNDVVKKYGNIYYIAPITAQLPNFKSPGTRTTPVRFNYPIYCSDSLSYIIPNEFVIKSIPGNKVIESNYGRYQIKSLQTANNKVLITKSFIIYPQDIKLDEYQMFYNFISSIKKYESAVINLTKQ